MNTYILGYPPNVDIISDNLVEYATKEIAAFESEEWCEVTAETLEQAKELYEVQFWIWHTNNT